MPDPGDRRPGIAVFAQGKRELPPQRFCTCALSKQRTCPHTLQLSEVIKFLRKKIGDKVLEEDFRASIWHRLAALLAEGSGPPLEAVRFNRETSDNGTTLRAYDSEGNELISYLSQASDGSRFLERCVILSDETQVPQRGSALEMLSRLTLAENERAMLERGFKTRRLVFEESLWYRVAYHGYREFGTEGCTFHPAIEEGSGLFTVTCRDANRRPVIRMVVPRHMVRSVLTAFKEYLPNQNDLPIHPVPLKSLFNVTLNTELDLEVLPLIRLIQEDGEERFFQREDLERFRYGDLVFIKELGIMAELERPGKERRFRAPVKMVLKKSQVPVFLETYGEEIREGRHRVDEKVQALRIYRNIDRIEISPESIERDWCWLSVRYAFGNGSVSLNDILSAKRDGQRYIGTKEGWVDCQSPDFVGVSEPFFERRSDDESGPLKLSRMDLLRLKSGSPIPLVISGGGKDKKLLNRILSLKPAKPLAPLKGMRSTLRKYQKLGTEWVLFLFENGLGGLLCDDMGLGKTHQVMALMLFLKEQRRVHGAALVVCPTTVLSHWENKIREHAPTLKAAAYYGGHRDLEEALKGDVLLTSYGILRRDIVHLKAYDFSLAAFDEIQYIKNPETLGYRAARDIRAGIKLGLTGTPIENTISELKALLDLTVPGYMGSDRYFEERYVIPIQQFEDEERKKELSRLTSPFTLRRLKKMVLDELPEKIEDIRTCKLSDDQVKLYRDTISTRGRDLLEALRKNDEPVPYIHIFALINLLKQICDHPSLLDGGPEAVEKYESGKWELFKELLAESLDSGQKVVVYSQYLGMLEIMARHLEAEGVDFVSLTGASRNRGKILDRFNDDPACRVYLGSLRAGGVGVDLVAASVVIHYDRWWNAAKEDQATDRVHRIGQKRGVQVFKLVTVGTLEEKISAIIEKKRNLMDSIVKEDDPGLLKTLSRDYLIEMLSTPQQ